MTHAVRLTGRRMQPGLPCLRSTTLVGRLLAACVLLLAVLLVPMGQAAAQNVLPVPALTDRVIDQTGTLSAADTAALEARLRALEAARGTQVVVLMVASTLPEDIAAYANRVGNQWKIGRRDVGDGLLVVVAKNDRKMRIEVAKSLEGAIPDIAAARIIDDAMKPRFRNDDFAGGLAAAVELIDRRLAGEALPAPSTPTATELAAQDEASAFWLAGACIVVMVLSPAARLLFGRVKGSLLVGGGVGTATLLYSGYWQPALLAGLLAMFFSAAGGGGRQRLRKAGRGGSVWTSGGWGGGGDGSSSSGGGFSSGGGGDFGGGGASGDW